MKTNHIITCFFCGLREILFFFSFVFIVVVFVGMLVIYLLQFKIMDSSILYNLNIQCTMIRYCQQRIFEKRFDLTVYIDKK